MNHETATWNVPLMESRVMELRKMTLLAHLNGAEKFLSQIAAHYGKSLEEFIAAIDEMKAVLDNSQENKTGYHLNCIHSGHTKYGVFREVDDPEEDNFVGEYDSQEAADAVAEETDESRYVTSYDPDEWWAVLDANNKNEFRMLYPTRARALLYHEAKPAAFTAFYGTEEEGEE